ncbi:hypothetical protein Sjap_020218 [Stephania japonica]|uniref:BHLH domain-containing protein n=1 Tax=Stephania japonica TaxID=461633 RepID=A0AAP0F101_9MAGN
MEELERFLLLDQEILVGECWDPSETPIQDYTNFMDLPEDQKWWLANFSSTTTVISSGSHVSPKLAGEDEAATLKDAGNYEENIDDELLTQLSFVLDPQELEEQQEQIRKLPTKCQQEEHQQQIDIEIFRNEEDDGDPESEEEDKKSDGAANSKNLQSERNRRKRLNQQLFTLRSLVPNITKMDKRSILVDALAYLQKIHEEIQNLTEETRSEFSFSLTSPSIESEPDHQPALPALYQRCASTLPEITKMNAQMLDDERFIVEIVCNKAIGVLSQVQRLIEMLGVEITCTSLSELTNQDRMVTTSFVRVKKKNTQMTPEKLLNRLRLNAKQLFTFILVPDQTILV